VLVSRGPGERLGPLFRGLYCSSPLGLGTRPYHLPLKPEDISYDVFGLYVPQWKTPLEAILFEPRLSSYRNEASSGVFFEVLSFLTLPIRIVRVTPVHVAPRGLDGSMTGLQSYLVPQRVWKVMILIYNGSRFWVVSKRSFQRLPWKRGRAPARGKGDPQAMGRLA